MESNTGRLPQLEDQAAKLIDLGLFDGPARGLTAGELMGSARSLEERVPGGALLVVSEAVLPPSILAPHLRLPGSPGGGDLPGFVVEDMTDVDAFEATGVTLPEAEVYAVVAPDRGDDLRNWTPAEALGEFGGRGREPLTLAEGIHWVLQDPSVLTRNSCFMTIASRKPKKGGRAGAAPAAFDSRTPALWISNGTGRDGKHRKNAPKVGWCWWNNRHTWLGFASAGERIS